MKKPRGNRATQKSPEGGPGTQGPLPPRAGTIARAVYDQLAAKHGEELAKAVIAGVGERKMRMYMERTMLSKKIH